MTNTDRAAVLGSSSGRGPEAARADFLEDTP